ncbi:SDR family oxidoreductase [Thermodesulfobacteriota bacterium]
MNENISKKERVLVVGATGYLGEFIVKELKRQGYWIRALSRDRRKIEPVKQYVDEVFLGEATQHKTLTGICKNIDIVFSSLGITRQKDGLTYMDVDYQGNKNIFNEARAENISKFMYISVFNANKLRHLEIVKAKERFAEELKKADLESIIIRPNGFFSDMTEFFNMAKRGRVYLFGNGEYRSNPIHGADLAKACVDRLGSKGGEFDIGGPEIHTQNEIASQAFDVLDKKPKITYIPLWIKNLIVKLVRIFTSANTYGPIEFFMTVLAMNMVAPTYGQHTIKEYYKQINEVSNN